MSFRNRPVLDRKHRPRWQDELRTQQLVVAGFALAIAVALGIFGATVWGSYYETHLRPVANVNGTGYDRAQLTAREHVLTAQLTSQAVDLQGQLGGARDSIIQQQIQAISLQLSSLTGDATSSLVEGAVLRDRADELGISVGPEEVDAEIAARRNLPERLRLSLIAINALPDDAEPGAEPIDEDFARAEEEAQAALGRVEGGEDFAAVATELSDDFTAQAGGNLGPVEADDPAYGDYFAAAAAADAEPGTIAGPIKTERGYAIVKLESRVDAGPNEALTQLLRENGVDDEMYRSFVRDELLREAYRTYFGEEVIVSPQPQRRVAQIEIAPVQGTPVSQERARHVLIQPIPDAQDQSVATDEQWAAALAKASEVRERLIAEDADWFAIAAEESADPGSKDRGGDLGWFDPNAAGFVPEFSDALAELEEGEVSEPVRTAFGYHLIQVIGSRTSPAEQAAELVTGLRDDPDSFATVAKQVSEDADTVQKGGEIGWVATYELDPVLEDAIFALDGEGAISEPITGSDGAIHIYRLLEISDSREVEADRLEKIRDAGFDRWLEGIKEPATIWVDPQFASSTVAG